MTKPTTTLILAKELEKALDSTKLVDLTRQERFMEIARNLIKSPNLEINSRP